LRKIETDRLIERLSTEFENKIIQIISDPNEIKQKIQHHFDIWTTPKQKEDISNFSDWKKQYRPKTNINLSYYNECLTPFTIDKLNVSIKNTKNNSAPGHTNIHYLTIKNLGPNSRTLLLQIFNLILITGEIPTDWKEGRIYPIPKSKDWQGDINITRPITLLDTFRKIFRTYTRIT